MTTEKAKLIIMLKKLQQEILQASQAMQPFDGEILEHAKELQNASKIVDTWIEGIEEEME